MNQPTQNWQDREVSEPTKIFRETSLAAVFHGRPGRLDLTFVRTPSPGDGEILVGIEGCVIGRHGLHSFQQPEKTSRPAIFGHEMTGHIEAFGPGSVRVDWRGRPLKRGTRIVWTRATACGDCFCCRRGITERCLRSSKYGHSAGEHERLLMGGFSERCFIVPGTSIVRIPQTLPLAVASQISGPTATAASAWRAIAADELRSILIVGAGLSGLTLVAMARACGVREVIVCDNNAERLEMASQFGATSTSSPEELLTVVSKATSGYGVDAAADFSGAVSAAELMMPQMRLGGTIVFLRSHSDMDYPPILWTIIASRQLTLIGLQGYQPEHLADAAEFMEKHHAAYPFEEAVSAWYSLEEAQDAAYAALNPRNLRVGITGSAP